MRISTLGALLLATTSVVTGCGLTDDAPSVDYQDLTDLDLENYDPADIASGEVCDRSSVLPTAMRIEALPAPVDGVQSPAVATVDVWRLDDNADDQNASWRIVLDSELFRSLNGGPIVIESDPETEEFGRVRQAGQEFNGSPFLDAVPAEGSYRLDNRAWGDVDCSHLDPDLLTQAYMRAYPHMGEFENVQFRADWCSMSVRMRQHCDDAQSGCYLDRTRVHVFAMGALYLGDDVLEEGGDLHYPNSITLFHSAASIDVDYYERLYSVGGPYNTQAWAAGEDGPERVEIAPVHFAVQGVDACDYPLSWAGFRYDQVEEAYLATPWWSRTTLTRPAPESPAAQ